MDCEKQLILIKDKNSNKFIDKTHEITSCRYDHGQYQVIFNNSAKAYPYGHSNVVSLYNPKIIDVSNTIVYINKKLRNDATKAYDFETYIRISFAYGSTSCPQDY